MSLNQRWKSSLTIALAGVAAVLTPHGVCQNAPLVTGRAITPLGLQVEVGSFPVNMALSPNGRHVVVTNSGYRQFLTVLDAQDGRVTDRIEVGAARSGKREGLYYGLAFGPSRADGSATLFVSRGAEQRVASYALSGEGKLSPLPISYVTEGKHVRVPAVIAGVATSPDGRTIYAADNTASAHSRFAGYVLVYDASGARKAAIETPGFPYGIAVVRSAAAEGDKVYATCERDGVVVVVDPRAGRVVRSIRTGKHPTGILASPAGDTLFVSNSGSDTLSIIDTRTDRVRATILLRPADVRSLPGCTPLGMALSPDGGTLYVALGDLNAVAIVDPARARLRGYLPTGWYPTAVVVSPDGKRLFVANAKGVNVRNPNSADVRGWGQYIQNIIEGTVSVVETPDDAVLMDLTARVIANNRLNRTPARFRNPGIRHVIYVIKENRTYDQVFGDLPQGNGDPSLCMFPREVTPNQHALAERFVLMDNFYVCAEVSADGWNWSTSGMMSEYVARNAPYNYSGRGRVYDFEGQNYGSPVEMIGLPDVATAPSGYIWDLCLKHGVSMRNYGFFLNFDEDELGPDGKPLARDNVPNKRALVDITDTNFRKYDMSYADSDAWVIHHAPAPNQKQSYGAHSAPSRISEWKREFDAFVRNRNLPRFLMLRLPRNHTSGTTPGASSPRAMVADNDYAVGQLVEAVSKSPYWQKTAIIILEDDAQNGHDHVDAHRSPCLVISPYVARATVDSAFYNTDSALRTMELLLGLPPMSQYDATAPVFACFTNKPVNAEPYEAILPPRNIIAEVNGATAYRAQDMAALDFTRPDAVPDELLNDVLWHAVMGADRPEPAPRYGLRMLEARRTPPRDAR